MFLYITQRLAIPPIKGSVAISPKSGLTPYAPPLKSPAERSQRIESIVGGGRVVFHIERVETLSSEWGIPRGRRHDRSTRNPRPQRFSAERVEALSSERGIPRDRRRLRPYPLSGMSLSSRRTANSLILRRRYAASSRQAAPQSIIAGSCYRLEQPRSVESYR